MATSPFDLRLLGGFALFRDAQPINLQPQPRRLVAYLALRPEPMLRRTIAEKLWPDRRETHAHAALRACLFQVEQTAPGLVTSASSSLALSGHVDTDVSRLGLLGQKSVSPQQLDEITRGDLLPDMDEDWLVFDRERCRQRRVRLLEELCRRFTESRNFAAAIDAGLAAVEAEPLRESSQRALIEAHLAEGNTNEARSQFTRFKEALDLELGIGPSTSLSELVSNGALDPVTRAVEPLR